MEIFSLLIMYHVNIQVNKIYLLIIKLSIQYCRVFRTNKSIAYMDVHHYFARIEYSVECCY